MSNSEPPPSPGGTRPGFKPVETQVQGVQLMPLLLKYFKTAGLLLLVWVMGYFGFSSAWIMIGLIAHVFSEEYKKIKAAKKAFARQAATGEKAAILARIDELPSWVYFPDIERAEWLNKMVKQMWPYIGQYVTDLLKTTIEPLVQNSLPASLTPFKFEQIDLGDIPPRIGGVKVYTENVKRDEIIIDLEIFFASDSQIKVAVRGMNAGIKDLTIHGIIRVVMKPLVGMIPIIGGLNVFFLNMPSVDFDLTDFANMLDMPLLNNTLRTVVEDQIAYYLVLPNKIPIQLVDSINLNQLKYPLPSGILRIHVMAGRDLKRADINLFGKGKSDPYIKMYVGAQVFKTKVIKDSVDPVWNEYFEAVVDQRHGQFVEIECLDEDPGEDDELGTASVDIEQISNSGAMDSWLPLENVKTGMLHLRALWLHLSKDPDDLDKEEQLRNQRMHKDFNVGFLTVDSQSEQHLGAALLMVNVDSAKNLPRSKKSMQEPNPYVKIGIGNVVRQGIPKPKTTDPKWEENFQFLIHNPRVQELFIEVLDQNKSDRRLGFVSISLKSLLTARDLTINRPFQLNESGPNAKVVVRLCLRILTSHVPEEWAMDAEPISDRTPTPDSPTQPEEDPAEPLNPTAEPQNPEVSGADVNENDKLYSAPDMDAVSNASSNFTPSPSMELRQRIHSSDPADAAFGRMQLTLRYSVQRSSVIVVIHKCTSLLPLDDDGHSDPYVRIYLLPDRSSSTKKKTQVVKNNLNPIFDETFEWRMSQHEASARTMDILVKNETGLFSRSQTKMGYALVTLSDFEDLTKPATKWYDLLDPDNYKQSRD